MKKSLFVIAASLISAAFASGFDTDVSLFSELNSAYNSGYFPGAVQYAEQLENRFPDSAGLGEALLIKGESLVRLNQASEAMTALEKASLLNETNPDLKNRCIYWKARAFELKGRNEEALNGYYEFLSKNPENKGYYADAVLRSGEIYYSEKDYEKAVPLLEYAVSNGNKYSAENWNDAVLNLMDSYCETGKSGKAVQLYSSISREDAEKAGLNPLLFDLYAGEAYEKSGDYKKAYGLYISVLESGDKSLASSALKRAYNVSSLHRKETGEEPGTVLQNAQKTLADNPELLGEFWTRLGADAYRDGDYKKALSYFDEAEKNASIELFLFASLYRAQIAAGVNPTKESAALAESMILKSRGILNEENSGIWLRESDILLARYAAVQEKWEDVKKYASSVNPQDPESEKLLEISLVKTGDYEKANELQKGEYTDLHGITLAKKGDLRNAAFIYSGIMENRELTETEKLNYAKVLITSGRYNEAQKVSASCSLIEAKYILGLSQFNTWSWPYAEENFSKYLNSSEKKNLSAVSYALFYLGYSQYRQGKNKEAAKNLSSFIQKYPDHELFWNALLTDAEAYSQTENYESAAPYAEKAVQTAPDSSSKEKAVMLLADIYSDSKEYQKAVDYLSPFVKNTGTLGEQSLYKTGQIYEKMNNLEAADKSYGDFLTRFKDSGLSEEVLFRRGQMYFNADNYDASLKRFEAYLSKYPEGKFSDGAVYYSAVAWERSGKANQAVLNYRKIEERYAESTYVYASRKNLMTIYASQKNYSDALKEASFLMENYPKQAKADGVNAKAVEIEKLSSGVSSKYVEKETEYKNAGGIETVQGRIKGTELASLYAENPVYRDEAQKLCEQLYAVQKNKGNEESIYAARNARLLSEMYRMEDGKKSGKMYMEAAKLFRMNSRDEEAAACLYGAWDSFRSAGLSGDADACAEQLLKLYPESSYAKNIKK